MILQNGEIIDGATIICTIGTITHHLHQTQELPLARGKITTQGDMSIAGHNSAWALGDCSLILNYYDNILCPPTAQFSDRQEKMLAKNIVATILGKSPQNFQYHPAGMLASIGHNKAVAEIYGIRFSGFIEFLIWRGIYLSKIPTSSRKVRVFLEWRWAMVFPPDISHLGFNRYSLFLLPRCSGEFDGDKFRAMANR